MSPKDIKSLRISLDLNQEDFANLLEVSKRSIANYESGESKPNKRTANKLLKLAQQRISDILKPKDEMLHSLYDEEIDDDLKNMVLEPDETIDKHEIYYLKELVESQKEIIKMLKDENKRLRSMADDLKKNTQPPNRF